MGPGDARVGNVAQFVVIAGIGLGIFHLAFKKLDVLGVLLGGGVIGLDGFEIVGLEYPGGRSAS